MINGDQARDIAAGSHQGSPLYDTLINVQSQNPRGDSSFGRQGFNYEPMQSEMGSPMPARAG